MTFKEELKNGLGIDLTSEQESMLNTYYQELIEYNKHTNLTRITEYNEVLYKHFFDSLTLVKSIDFNHINSICDMGSGAGFPSIPLKIVFNHLEVSIVDSLNKRIIFLNHLTDKLNLKNINLYHERIESFAQKQQNRFDLVTARALGNMSLISEMGIPMVKLNGYFIAMKSSTYDEELDQAKSTIHQLGGKIISIIDSSLPNSYGSRSNISIQKIKHVSGFPRQYQTMINKPL